jgi:hypothetical protein
LLVGLATAGMAFFGRPRGKNATTKHSTEDAEGLLNTLLMVCTFTLGFSVSFIAIYNYDDLQEMDRRFASDRHSGLDGSQWIGDSWTLDKTYFVGFMFFYATVAAAAMGMYPKYCGVVSQYPFTYWGQLTEQVHNATTREMQQGCVTGNALIPAGVMITALNVFMPVVVVGVMTGTYALQYFHNQRLADSVLSSSPFVPSC